MSTLLARLRDVKCDREPFTPEHAQCICRLANEAADEIERLRNLSKPDPAYEARMAKYARAPRATG